VGNSSAGIRETPFYGLPSINVGDRQNARYFAKSIMNVGYDSKDIKNAIEVAMSAKRMPRDDYFGNGNSTEKFIELLENENIWHAVGQKLFNDVNFTADKPIHMAVA
ncbi:UDP-N-acetylglucosamine 2-epimerase, partial [Aeromonas veronii]